MFGLYRPAYQPLGVSFLPKRLWPIKAPFFRPELVIAL